MSPRAPMKNRVVRVSDSVWAAAMAASVERGENLSEEIRAFLVRYAKGEK